jgi:N-acetylmuramoyl-L-alanine amidase
VTAPRTFKVDSKLAHDKKPAVNVEPRRGVKKPSLLILHYTGMPDAERAIKWLACEESKVSCHYVIDELGRITQMVPERLRAWHAGQSFWRGETDINSHSIGIEIQNPGHAHGYPAFPKTQMAAVIALSRDIVKRHAMKPGAVLAHSDVAPQRKIDPGEKFNWAEMAENGLGEWVRASPVRSDDDGLSAGSKGDVILAAQKQLAAYGYDVSPTGELDARTSHVIRAFQLHFRPHRIDGRLDRSTLSTLARVLTASGRSS